ncbi:Clp protease N-terminal domain-containing protein [Nocardia paucivorans]|uniref:Clp protease N-terminal domain-containing protein n=1 Tax=Nocardia paucivorans TaxID=114259 RepID=UPI000593614C|nr:Clp protease N-terminal domain-containing protein [Nocardia paucivorans]
MFERFAREARLVVVSAQEDARELRSPDIRVEHLLLGLLAHGGAELATLLAEAGVTLDHVRKELAGRAEEQPLGPADAEALRAIGIDLDAVRESLAESFGADALDRALPPESRGPFGLGRKMRYGHIPFGKDSKKVLELSLREAAARREKTIESGHILLAILRAPNSTTAALLGGDEGIALLRERIHALLDRAA